MAEATTPAPAISIGGYSSGQQLSEAELAEWNERAERRREEIGISSLATIGRGPNGRPLPSPDAAEGERLATADLA